MYNIYYDSHPHDPILFSIESNAKDLMEQAHIIVHRHQSYSTKMLKERTHEIHRLKMTLERAIRAHMDEISSLAEQHNRLMRTMSVLELPESIGNFPFYCIYRSLSKFLINLYLSYRMY